MTRKDDGGAAFARPPSWSPGYQPTLFGGSQGMSLRDWFAGMSLGHIPALLAANDKNKSVKQIASWAYEVADAMLEARKQ